MVSHDDVIWCYRSILGREPESQTALERHVSAVEDFRSLVLRFLSSQEYRSRLGSQSRIFVPFDGPEMHVDLSVSATELSRLRDRIRQAWTHMGASRPYHSVLTAADYLPQNLTEESIQRFYESGVKEAGIIKAALIRNGVSDLQSKVCVEFGCGLGRVTLGLATLFKSVFGYDISPNHLEAAEKRARDTGVRNVQFRLCRDTTEEVKLEKCDFFYSQLVFQHNPPPVMRALIKTALASLQEGGVGIFQLPTYSLNYKFRLREYLSGEQHLTMEMHILPQSEVFSLVAEAGCQVLEVREDNAIGGSLGQWISNKFVVKKVVPPIIVPPKRTHR